MAVDWTPRRVDHVGVAVRSITTAARFYRDVLGLEVGPPEALPDIGVTVAFVRVGTTRIELVEPLGASSPVGPFLARRGEGVHHIALAVADVAAAVERARESGFTPIEERPRRGAHGTRIAFLHPKGTHGVLIELVERAS